MEDALRQELSRCQDELQVLEAAMRLGQAATLDETCQELLRLVVQVSSGRSAALIRNGQILAVRSIDSDAWKDVELTRRETLDALDNQPAAGRTPLLQDREPEWVLFPIRVAAGEVLAFLYLGLPAQTSLLFKLAGYFAPFLQAALRGDALEELGKRQNLALQLLEQRSRALAQLVAWTQETEEWRAALRSGLERLFPERLRWIALDDWKFTGDAPEGWRGWTEILTAPLLFEDVRQTRLQRFGEARALLLAPLPGENGAALFVGSPEPGAFDGNDLHILTLFAARAAALVRGARSQEELKASQGRLAQAGKMAAIGQLAAGLAHELNTPLASITISVEGARRLLPADLEKPRRRLDNALQTLETARSLVEKLLFYSRASEGARRSVDLPTIVADSLELVKNVRQRAIEVDLQPVPTVSGNAQELQQVVTNLVLNALDAGGPVLVRCSVEGPQVVVSIEDKGEGIVPEVQARLFEPFFTTKDVGSGTGLGLSISREIVEGHGGKIGFRTVPGQGSRFWFALPVE